MSYRLYLAVIRIAAACRAWFGERSANVLLGGHVSLRRPRWDLSASTIVSCFQVRSIHLSYV